MKKWWCYSEWGLRKTSRRGLRFRESWHCCWSYPTATRWTGSSWRSCSRTWSSWSSRTLLHTRGARFQHGPIPSQQYCVWNGIISTGTQDMLELKNIGSRMDMRTHAGCNWYPCDLDLWPTDLRINPCRATAILTNKHSDATERSTHAGGYIVRQNYGGTWL